MQVIVNNHIWPSISVEAKKKKKQQYNLSIKGNKIETLWLADI